MMHSLSIAIFAGNTHQVLVSFSSKYLDLASKHAMLPINRSLPYEKCRGTLHILFLMGFGGRLF